MGLLNKPKVQDITREVVRLNNDWIIETNRDQLYENGQVDTTRPRYKERYAPATIAQKKKNAKYKKTDFITLRWMGDFFESFKVIDLKHMFIIQATDLKWNWLQKRFPKALGLTEHSKEELKKRMFPDVKKRILKEL